MKSEGGFRNPCLDGSSPATLTRVDSAQQGNDGSGHSARANTPKFLARQRGQGTGPWQALVEIAIHTPLIFVDSRSAREWWKPHRRDKSSTPRDRGSTHWIRRRNVLPQCRTERDRRHTESLQSPNVAAKKSAPAPGLDHRRLRHRRDPGRVHGAAHRGVPGPGDDHAAEGAAAFLRARNGGARLRVRPGRHRQGRR